MDLKATIAGGYRNRLILITLGAMLYAAWCLYDATKGYPDKQEIFQKYTKVQKENPDNWQEVWAQKIKVTGWPEQPKEVSDWNIKTQWIQFGIVFPIGAYCLFSLVVWSRRYVGADASKLYSHGGVEVPFDQITSVDAARWENKGIARVYYDGKSILIDDWKYQREPSNAIFERVRENIDAEKISGLSEPEEAEADTPTEAEAESNEPAGEIDQDEPTATPTN